MDVQDSTGYHHGLVLFLYAVVKERMKKMNIEINGVTLQVDFMDADFMDIFEPALYEMRDGVNKSKTMNGSISAKYKALNQSVEAFFDRCFGEGTADSIFQGGKNVMVHLQAVSCIDDAYKAEKKQFNDFSNRYTQQQNGFKSMQGYQKKQKAQHSST